MIRKLLNNNTLIKGGLFSIFSFFNQGISFLLLIILANYISPKEYGNLSIFYTVVMFLGYFIGLSTHGYISVSYFKHDKVEFRKNFTTIYVIAGGILLILLALIIMVGNKFSSLISLNKYHLYVALFICYFQFLLNLNLDLERIKEKIFSYGLISCGFAVLNCLFTLLLVIGFQMSWQGRIYAHLLVCFIFGCIAMAYFKKCDLFLFHIDCQRIKTIIMWGVPLIPHLATNWIKQGCDRYIINYNYTLDEVGLFSFALNMTNVITMVGFAFNQINSIEIYKILGGKSINDKLFKLKKLRNSMYKIYSLATIMIIIMGIIIIKSFLPRYSDSIIFFIILSLYGFGVCVYLIYCNYLFYFGKNKQVMYITFISAICHLGLSLLLTRYNLLFTAIVYIVSQIYIVFIIRRKGLEVLKKYI